MKNVVQDWVGDLTFKQQTVVLSAIRGCDGAPKDDLAIAGRRRNMPGLLPEGYDCPECGRENKFSTWVYAHAHVQIIHTCECGAKNIINDLKCIGTKDVPCPPLRAK